jgi:hypothetical protein
VRRFGPASGEEWPKFLAWSALAHLQEVVSLDGILCPTVFQQSTAEDWGHNLHEDFKTTLFYDLDHILVKAAGDDGVNVLALLQNPTAGEVRSFSDPRFVFRGFDLVDVRGDVSALVNCGGFDKAFAAADLSDCGLLADHARALRVRQRLWDEHAGEPHAADGNRDLPRGRACGGGEQGDGGKAGISKR